MTASLVDPQAIQLVALCCGALAGLGVWGVVAALFTPPAANTRVRVTEVPTRIASSLRDVSAVARGDLEPRLDDPVSVFGVVVSPLALRLSGLIDRLLGGSESAARTVALAGAPYSVAEYRLRRVIAALLGAALGLGAIAVVSASRGVLGGANFLTALIASGVGLIAGAGTFDRSLRKRIDARARRLSEEFPSVLELLTLALAAGESLPGAISRIATRGSGELAREWSRVMRRVELGEPLAQALRDSAQGLGVTEVSAMVEHLATALDRGAPLVEVVRSHSADSRNHQLRAIVERAGKAEVWMLVPLVLFILPTTVIFAVWPSLQALQLGL